MFSLSSKLDQNLKYALKENMFKTYRVIIHCKNLLDKTEIKIISCKCEVHRSISSVNCICATLSNKVIERLLELPQVDYIGFDEYGILCGSSVLSANGISRQMTSNLTGKGIGIGIIDSGVYPHADLSTPNSKIANFTDIINNLKYPYDDNGHGTFMCGVISGNGSSSKGMYRGIAQNSKLYMVKAFNKLGRAFVSDILFALETLINEGGKNNIRVICLPFEIFSINSFILSMFSQMFDIAIKNDITVVVPSGNNYNVQSSLRGIACLENCITVAGLDTRTSVSPYLYSSSGPINKMDKPNLSAACVDICSLNCDTEFISERNGMKVYSHKLDSPYTCYTGTSCAAAFISGICALLYEKKKDLKFKDICSLLALSCKLQNIKKWQQGLGTIDFDKLLE